MLGTGVELNGDGLDPAHGLVAVAAAKFQVLGGNFQVGRNFKFELRTYELLSITGTYAVI